MDGPPSRSLSLRLSLKLAGPRSGGSARTAGAESQPHARSFLFLRESSRRPTALVAWQEKGRSIHLVPLPLLIIVSIFSSHPGSLVPPIRLPPGLSVPGLSTAGFGFSPVSPGGASYCSRYGSPQSAFHPRAPTKLAAGSLSQPNISHNPSTRTTSTAPRSSMGPQFPPRGGGTRLPSDTPPSKRIKRA